MVVVPLIHHKLIPVHVSLLLKPRRFEIELFPTSKQTKKIEAVPALPGTTVEIDYTFSISISEMVFKLTTEHFQLTAEVISTSSITELSSSN